MIRTVADLIEALQDLVSSNPEAGELPLRAATQPSYPLHVKLDNVRIGRVDGIEGKEDFAALYFVCGNVPYDERPYASSDLWEEGNGLVDDLERCMVDEIDWDAATANAMDFLREQGTDMSAVNVVDTDESSPGVAVITVRIDNVAGIRQLQCTSDGEVKELSRD